MVASLLNRTFEFLHYLMKILHISYAKTWGGGEQQMIDLIESLSNLGVENSLICFQDSALYDYGKKNQLSLLPIANKKLNNLAKLISTANVDVIHIHTGSFLKDFLLLNIFFEIKTPTVYTINGIMRKKSFFSKLKYNNKNITAYYFVSNAVRDHFKNGVAFKRSLSKMNVVYDGIKTETIPAHPSVKKELDIPEDSILIGNVANHTRAKNLGSFMRVANEIVNKKNRKNFHFIQIGRHTNYTEEFNSYITKNNLQQNVHLIGFKENAEAYMQNFDVFLMTSNREGMSLSIIQALKYKIPVVSTNAGGIPEVITDNVNGLLLNIDDDEGLANQILLLLEDARLQERFKENGYKKFLSHFTAERMGKETLKIYSKILDEK